MGSTRFPGKILFPLVDGTVLDWAVKRTAAAKLIDKLVVATTTAPLDDEIADYCQKHGISCFRGSENDVLDRYYQCALEYKADIVIRITSDCPLIDPALIDHMVGKMIQDPSLSYSSNVEPTTYPEGQSVEVMSMAAVTKAWHEVTDPPSREHVTPYIRFHKSLFKSYCLKCVPDASHLRMTVDYEDDARMVKGLLAALKEEKNWPDFTVAQAIAMLESREDLLALIQTKQRDQWRKTIK